MERCSKSLLHSVTQPVTSQQEQNITIYPLFNTTNEFQCRHCANRKRKKKALHNLFPSCVLTAGSEMDDPAMKSPPSTILKNYVIVGSSQISGQAALFHPSGQKSSEPHGRGQVTTPTGSPHLAAVHLPLPPSRVIEELHRALATKHRQDRYLQPPGSRAA